MVPESDFSVQQTQQISKLGEVVYAKSRDEYPLEKLKKLARGTVLLGADPDILGGFEKASTGRLTSLMESLPGLKYVALSGSSPEWVDLDYCRRRKIIVTNVPYYSTESVAEHTLGLLICLAKKIIVGDRRTQKGKYQYEMGFELKGKTLGIIGLGHIGSRVAELGHAIGMKVIAYNRTLKQFKNVEMKSLDEVLSQSDAISINLTYNSGTHHLISKPEIKKMKKGVIIVNITLVGREIVDEKEMARALKSGKVGSYAYEGEDLETGPLFKVENAIGLKGFAWYTKEALGRAMQIWTESIVSLAKGKPINVVG
jgi:lactate dehydrogenase-like 2-hydroxyacid dehydrogenase